MSRREDIPMTTPNLDCVERQFTELVKAHTFALDTDQQGEFIDYTGDALAAHLQDFSLAVSCYACPIERQQASALLISMGERRTALHTSYSR